MPSLASSAAASRSIPASKKQAGQREGKLEAKWQAGTAATPIHEPLPAALPTWLAAAVGAPRLVAQQAVDGAGLDALDLTHALRSAACGEH